MVTGPFQEAQEAVMHLLKDASEYAYVDAYDGSVWMEGSFTLSQLQFIVNTLEHAQDDLFK